MANPDHLNHDLIESVQEVVHADRAAWDRIRRFWLDGRTDEWGESVALMSMIFYATVRRLSRR